MPHYEMRDAFGMMYRLSTQDRETAQRWFDEWLPVLYPADAPAGLGLPVLAVYPMSPTGGPFDWPADNRYLNKMFTIPRDPALALAAIDQERAWIERQVASANGK